MSKVLNLVVLDRYSSLYLSALAPWSIGGSPAGHQPSGSVWSGVDGFCAGDVEPSSFVEKLIRGKQGQGDRELLTSLGGVASVASQGVPRRGLVSEKRSP
jgi:hypothetical protein